MDVPQHFSDRRKIGPGKIDPRRGETLADGSPNKADRGDKIGPAADRFAREVRDLVRRHGGDNRRLAVDKVMLHGLRALEAQGFEVMDGARN